MCFQCLLVSTTATCTGFYASRERVSCVRQHCNTNLNMLTALATAIAANNLLAM